MTLSLKRWFLLIPGLVALTGCRLVDQDLTDCGVEYQLEYELQLVTNITTEIETELSLDTDINVATALETYLNDVFTDRAHDVDLSFYAVDGDKRRLHHEHHIMDATQTSYTLRIPVNRYLHLGLANLENNPLLSLVNDQTSPGSRLQQEMADTLRPHREGVFSARADIDIQEGKDQQFKVSLYMANCAAALVLDTLGSGIRDIRAYATGFATAFDVADSVYRFQQTSVIEADRVEVEEAGSELCFATVNFPSRTPETKAEEEDEDQTYWEFHVYATVPGGSITESRLYVKRPLLPAHLEIIKAKVYGNGSLQPGDATVGVDVSLDWNPGMEHNVDV